MVDAYIDMHRAGFASSIECWDSDDNLVGGLYGITLGSVFFGESMFSQAANASKLCLKYVMDSGAYEMIDCQLPTQHLSSLGAIQMNRTDFESMLNQHTYPRPGSDL
jgi:leucyl/phenylalanyl-tRNA--protein transferase